MLQDHCRHRDLWLSALRVLAGQDSSSPLGDRFFPGGSVVYLPPSGSLSGASSWSQRDATELHAAADDRNLYSNGRLRSY